MLHTLPQECLGEYNMGSKGTSEITLQERKIIERSLAEGIAEAKIGMNLGRSKKTIYNEIKRYKKEHEPGTPYNAEIAQQDAMKRKALRSEKNKKAITEEQDNIIRSSIAQQIPINIIRRLSGLSYYRLMGHINTIKIQYQAFPGASLHERIEAVEQHIIIIIEQLRRLK